LYGHASFLFVLPYSLFVPYVSNAHLFGQALSSVTLPVAFPYDPAGQLLSHATPPFVDPLTFPYFPDGHTFSQNKFTAGDTVSGIRLHRPVVGLHTWFGKHPRGHKTPMA